MRIKDVIQYLNDEIQQNKKYQKNIAEDMKHDELNYAYYRGEMLQCENVIQRNYYLIHLLESCLEYQEAAAK